MFKKKNTTKKERKDFDLFRTSMNVTDEIYCFRLRQLAPKSDDKEYYETFKNKLDDVADLLLYYFQQRKFKDCFELFMVYREFYEVSKMELKAKKRADKAYRRYQKFVEQKK